MVLKVEGAARRRTRPLWTCLTAGGDQPPSFEMRIERCERARPFDVLEASVPFIAPDVLVALELFIVLGELEEVAPLVVEPLLIESLVEEPLVAESLVVDALLWLEPVELFSCTSPPAD